MSTEPPQKITFEVPPELRRRFKAALAQQGKTQQELLEEFVRKYVERAKAQVRGE